MLRVTAGIVAALAAVSLGATPAVAKTPKRRIHSPKVSCTEIRDAITSGKSADQVAKDLKVSETRVKSCTTATQSVHPSLAK